MDNRAKILVNGDFVLDHHIYEGRRHDYDDRAGRGVQDVEELGGAALIHYLLGESKGIEPHLSVEVTGRIPALPAGLRVPVGLSAYAVWKPFGRERNAPAETAVWRTEDAMGFGCRAEAGVPFEWPVALERPARPDVVVLSDGGMGFRNEQPLWPSDDVLRAARWIVLKTVHPFATGPLWERLTADDCRDKLVLVASSTELRKGPAWIGAGLSWDATVESVLAALGPGGAYEALTVCCHVVIAFGSEGGLWLETGGGFSAARAHFVYDAAAIEGDHDERGGPGTAFGALSCLTAAVAHALADAPAKETPDLETALEGGLSAMYDLFERGHGPATAPGEGFPAKRLAKILKEATCRYSRTAFDATAPTAPPPCPPPPSVAPCWSIMLEALRQQGQHCPDPAWDLAERVARHGPIALSSLPHLAIGNLVSADRREIESLRILRRLIQDYKNRSASACKKPLSIGVFGPPGSGKSFAVREIARALMGPDDFRDGWMEFNLSQFSEGSTDDLIGAFHQIRDRVLRAKVPIAFFDEFDSRDYAWLQYLLAPMQDGAFQEGQITHPIGKCIFVFAGATSSTFESFGPPEENKDDLKKFRMLKGPDFKSRLDGILNVLGPNPRRPVKLAGDKLSYTEGDADRCDLFFPVRRALVLRSELGCKPAHQMDVDAALLREFLRVSKYQHGSRSIGKLAEPFRACASRSLSRSLLPPPQQRRLYVEEDTFEAACRALPEPPPPAAPIDTPAVARAIHNTYRALGIRDGWLKEKSKDDVAFDELDAFYVQSNMQAAKRMTGVLGLIGLTLEPGRNTQAELIDIRQRIEYNLELLAQAEHAGWMQWHLEQGWQYGSNKPANPHSEPPDRKTHPCLRPYRKLSDLERNKDRNSIRHYPEFAKTAGMKIGERRACSP